MARACARRSPCSSIASSMIRWRSTFDEISSAEYTISSMAEEPGAKVRGLRRHRPHWGGDRRRFAMPTYLHRDLIFPTTFAADLTFESEGSRQEMIVLRNGTEVHQQMVFPKFSTPASARTACDVSRQSPAQRSVRMELFNCRWYLLIPVRGALRFHFLIVVHQSQMLSNVNDHGRAGAVRGRQTASG